jgi:hypothetical protein
MWTRIMPISSIPACEDGDCEHRNRCSIHISADEGRRNSVSHPALTVLPHAPPTAWTGSSGPCIACSRHLFQYELAKPEQASG